MTKPPGSVAMELSAVSRQLRQPRALSLVNGVRRGRRIEYSLCGTHVAQLLDEAACRSEHPRLGAPATFPHGPWILVSPRSRA